MVNKRRTRQAKLYMQQSREGFRKKSFVLVKIFVNPSLLEHGLVLQRAKRLAEEEVIRKLPSYINSLDRKNLLVMVYFKDLPIGLINYSSIYKIVEEARFVWFCLVLFFLYVSFFPFYLFFLHSAPLRFIVKCTRRSKRAFIHLSPAWQTLLLFCCPLDTPVLGKLDLF